MNDGFAVGRAIPRLEGKEKVTGQLQYLSDLKIPHMLHGKILRSTVAHGRIKRIDASKAEQLPGVVAVLTRDDVLRNTQHKSHYGPVFKDQTVVAIDKVRYVGDPVAAVAAADAAIAEEALELIEVDYDPLPTVCTPEEALAPDAPLLHEFADRPEHEFADLKDIAGVSGTNICSLFKLQKGHAARGFAEADRVFEDVFSTPAAQHAALESFTTVAQFDPSGRLTVWSTVQNPFVIRDQLAELFNLPESMVRVIVLYLGGSYGSKQYPKLEPLVAALAHKARQPVGITLTREEVFHTITKHGATVRLKTGVKKDGTIVARDCQVYLNTGAYAEIGPRVCKKAGYTAGGPYLIPNLNIESRLIYTNCVPAGAFRGFGVTQTTWAHESQLSMIARKLNIDPLEMMLKNLVDEGDEFATGERIQSFGLRECLQKAAQAIDWGKKSRSTDSSKAIGKGLACAIKSTITPSSSSAHMRLNDAGTVHVYVGTVEMGQASDTTMAQIAAEELGIPIDRITIVHSDTDLTPYDLSTSSSRSTFHMGRAVQLAAQDLKRQLALSGTGAHSVVGSGTVNTNTLKAKGEHQTSAFWFAGAGAAEVEVDRETGLVRVLRYAAVVDVGKPINPVHCEQQLRGAAIFGIGQALLEQMVYQDGLLINPNFLDYNLPRFLDVPKELIAVLVEHPHAEGPHGAKGIGETAIIPVAPAIANAVEDAVGARVNELPITPERVLRALRAAEMDAARGAVLSN